MNRVQANLIIGLLAAILVLQAFALVRPNSNASSDAAYWSCRTVAAIEDLQRAVTQPGLPPVANDLEC